MSQAAQALGPADDIIHCQEVHRRYGGAEVLRGVSLRIRAGELLALRGRSGSGKSTLLHIIGGLDRGFSGAVRVCERDLAALSDRDLSALRNQEIGFVFQSFHLLEHLSCRENVTLPDAFAPTPRSPDAARRRAEEVLEQVGLGDRADARPAELSGGQKQRVAIARALFYQPRLLLCDEPTGNLDTHTGQQIIDLFRSLRRQRPLTLVLVTHEDRVAEAADRVLELCDGQLVTA